MAEKLVERLHVPIQARFGESSDPDCYVGMSAEQYGQICEERKVAAEAIERLEAELAEARAREGRKDRLFHQVLNCSMWVDDGMGGNWIFSNTVHKEVSEALAAPASKPHDPKTGPCPTCGFQVRRVERQPFAIENDESAPEREAERRVVEATLVYWDGTQRTLTLPQSFVDGMLAAQQQAPESEHE